MVSSAPSQTTYPKVDEGFFHLTATGWRRQDTSPFPADRIETWRFRSETPADDAKQQVHLERLWICHHTPAEERDQIRAHFGYPFRASHDLHLTIDCRD
jgi:hypothetical protein